MQLSESSSRRESEQQGMSGVWQDCWEQGERQKVVRPTTLRRFVQFKYGGRVNSHPFLFEEPRGGIRR
ncbi:hypothetical protein GJAV_G00137060 [Gymnothorax javanicus]|nr:hypothetical protein GJAV_G00137060 [Gymnothorax javanicus]